MDKSFLQNFKNLQNLSSKIRNAKLKQAAIILLGAVISALSVWFAFLIKGVVEAANSGENLIASILITGVVAVIIFVLSALINFLSEKFKIEAETSIKKYVVNGYVQKSYANGLVTTGDVVTRIESEAVNFSSAVMTIIPKIATSVITLLMVIVAIFIINSTFGLVVAAAGIVVLVVTIIVRKITVKLYKKTREEDAKVSSFLTEVDENLLTVKGLRAEDEISNKFDKKLTPYEKAKKGQRYFQAGFSSLIPFVFNVTFLVAVILSKEYVIGLVAIIQLIMQARTPITSFSSLIASYYEMGVSATRLTELVGEETNYSVANGDFEYLEVKNVNFSYENELVLEDFSLLVNAGEKVVIKGQTGAGKTTLLKLLTGIFKPVAGGVNYYYNGSSYLASDVKNAFSVAYQGNMIFSGSLKENLLLSNKNATESEINNAINFAVLNDVVSVVGGLDGEIGERGATLSEGERQRLAIARAIISNASVIILDEPTSALDNETKAKLLDNVKNSNKTFIIVSHDDDVVNIASKIVTIK